MSAAFDRITVRIYRQLADKPQPEKDDCIGSAVVFPNQSGEWSVQSTTIGSGEHTIYAIAEDLPGNKVRSPNTNFELTDEQ